MGFGRCFNPDTHQISFLKDRAEFYCGWKDDASVPMAVYDYFVDNTRFNLTRHVTLATKQALVNSMRYCADRLLNKPADVELLAQSSFYDLIDLCILEITKQKLYTSEGFLR